MHSLSFFFCFFQLEHQHHHHHHHLQDNKQQPSHTSMRFASSDKTCWSKTDGPPGCCPLGSVDTGEVEDCEHPVAHGSSFLGRHCQASALSILHKSKKTGWRSMYVQLKK